MQLGAVKLELLRFACVGLLATGVYVGSALLLNTYLGVSMPVAAAISFLIVIVMNYVLHYSWTFRTDAPHSTALPRFLTMAAGAFIINSSAVSLGARWAAAPHALLLTMGAALAVIWNYLFSRFWVFVSSRNRDSTA